MSPATARAPFGRVTALLARLPSGPVIGAEVGIFRGAMASQLLRARPDLTLLMVDSWLPREQQPAAYLATGDGHARHTPDEQAANRQRADRETQFAGSRRRILHMGSAAAARTVAAASLDFVFLDADHSTAGVTADIETWLPKVKPGGLLGGHDYGDNPAYAFGVVAAVDAAVARYGWGLKTDQDWTWFVRV